MMKITYVLMLIYSPASPYFNGFTFEVRDDLAACQAEISQRIGHEFQSSTGIGWEREMMGPIPKVIGGLCAPGGFAPDAR